MASGRSIPGIARLVRHALQEDIGPGDVTTASTMHPEWRARARVVARQDLVLSGLEPARLAFEFLDPSALVVEEASEGGAVLKGAPVLLVEGYAAPILSAERTALNFLGWMSGVATLTRRCVDAVRGTRAVILDTRKTIPGLRPLLRHAVAAGGGVNHRAGLYDACLIKDNHIVRAGGAGAAVRAALARGAPRPIEVEIERLDQVEEVLEAGAEIVLLDNMTPEAAAEATRRIRSVAGDGVLVEASGGITLQNLADYARAGVDRISLGFITHSAPCADFALEVEPAAP